MPADPRFELCRPLKRFTQVVIAKGAGRGRHGYIEEILSHPHSNEAMTGMARYGVRLIMGGNIADVHRHQIRVPARENRRPPLTDEDIETLRCEGSGPDWRNLRPDQPDDPWDHTRDFNYIHPDERKRADA